MVDPLFDARRTSVSAIGDVIDCLARRPISSVLPRLHSRARRANDLLGTYAEFIRLDSRWATVTRLQFCALLLSEFCDLLSHSIRCAPLNGAVCHACTTLGRVARARLDVVRAYAPRFCRIGPFFVDLHGAPPDVTELAPYTRIDRAAGQARNGIFSGKQGISRVRRRSRRVQPSCASNSGF